MCDAPGLSICCSLGLQRPSGGGGECEGSVVAAERKLNFRVAPLPTTSFNFMHKHKLRTKLGKGLLLCLFANRRACLGLPRYASFHAYIV